MITDVFFIPYKDDLKIVYAPLRRMVFTANQMAVNGIRTYLESDGTRCPSTAIKEQMDRLMQKPSQLIPPCPNIDDRFTRLTVLPTFQCNFHCSYCFSAEGRAKQSLSTSTICRALDFCVDRALARHRKDTYIGFTGGGEPLMAWPTVREVLVYAQTLAQQKGIPIKSSLTTNGSLLTQDILVPLISFQTHLMLSFDILPDVQNSQRGHFDLVHKNLSALAAHNYPAGIRATITPASVSRMIEMVEAVHTHYPTVNTVHLEPVTDPNLPEGFYTTFLDAFDKIHPLAQSYGLCVDYSVTLSAQHLSNRFCKGEFCLTPYGTCIICHRAATPSETINSLACFGSVHDKEGVRLDWHKAHLLLDNGAATQDRCRNCFAKYQCAGGCFYQNNTLPAHQQASLCDFYREGLRRKLQAIIENQALATSGQESSGSVKDTPETCL